MNPSIKIMFGSNNHGISLWLPFGYPTMTQKLTIIQSLCRIEQLGCICQICIHSVYASTGRYVLSSLSTLFSVLQHRGFKKIIWMPLFRDAWSWMWEGKDMKRWRLGCSTGNFNIFNLVYFVSPKITSYKFSSEGFTICTQKASSEWRHLHVVLNENTLGLNMHTHLQSGCVLPCPLL